MQVIQEDTVRQLYLKKGVTEIHVEDGGLITQQARDYIRDNRLTLVEEGKPMIRENGDIRPPVWKGEGKYQTEDGGALDQKPEYMTHLYGTLLVSKNHPRIAFRGKVDSMEAAILELQYRAARAGKTKLVDDLEEILSYCRTVLACEVKGEPLRTDTLLGMDGNRQREVSHNPKKYFGVGHLLMNYQMSEWCLGLNALRTQARELELAAVNAFVSADGTVVEREDILLGLNRLSSVFYIMMCHEAANA